MQNGNIGNHHGGVSEIPDDDSESHERRDKSQYDSVGGSSTPMRNLLSLNNAMMKKSLQFLI
jgi:hypothetical protein